MKNEKMDNIQLLQLIKKLINNPEDYKYMLQGYIDEQLETNNKQKLIKIENDENHKNLTFKMAGIKLRKDGLYEIRKMVNGYRKSFYTRSFNTAKKIKKELDSNKICINENKKKNKNKSLREWLIFWRENYKKPFVSKQTYRNILLHTNTIIKKLGDIEIKKLTSDDIQLFFNEIPKSRTKELIFLYFNASMKFAYERDLIKKDLFKTVIKDKKIKSIRIGYTMSEQIKILNIIKKTSIEEEILFYLLTGIRKNELPQKNDFDFQNNLVKINGTKTEKSKRIIELSESYSKHLKEYFKNNKFLSTDRITKIFRNLCKEADIKNANIHRLRHTFANNQYTLGTDIKQLQYWLGHSTINMTLDIYTNIDRTLKKEKIKEIYNNYYYVIKN